MNIRRLRYGLVAAVAASSLAAPALAEDAYVVGLSGALTGPGAGTYAPVIEALRIYIDQVNAKGGVNGKPIRLVIQDDQAQPSKAAAEAKKLIAQDNVLLLINTSLSSTYAPMIAEAKRGRAPILFGGSVCPTETFPKADALQYCTTSFGARYDSRFSLGMVKEMAKEPVKLGMVAMAIPVARGEVDYAAGLAKEMGMTVVANEAVPPPTADYAPVATKLKEAGANWGFSWSPWVTQVRTFEALRKLGWEDRFITYAHLNAEDDLARLKDDRFIVFGATALFGDDLPVHKEIRAAAEKAGAKSPVTQLAEGWVVGMTVEAIMKNVAWPPSREKVVAAMNNLSVDTKGLRGAPITWTADNHFRTKQCYRAYHWDSGKNAVARMKDWTCYDVK